MKKSILIILLQCFVSTAAIAATGDITAVRINSSGWFAEIDIEGLDTGGTYAMGWGTNNDPTACKVVLTATSPSWSDTGTSTTIYPNGIKPICRYYACRNESTIS